MSAFAIDIPFTDVPSSSWFYADVVKAYNDGLINGTSNTTFSPEGTVTYAQLIKIASCIHQKENSGVVSLKNGQNAWYSTYVEYAKKNSIINSDYPWDNNATRSDCAELLKSAMSNKMLKSKNRVDDGSIPDVPTGSANYSSIYALYRAGIIVGNDAIGTFNPNGYLQRSELAAILTRISYADTRKSITLVSGSDTLIQYAQIDVGNSTLRVREGPGTEHNIIGNASHGSIFPILNQVGKWYEIIFDGSNGFVHADYVNVLDESEISSLEDVTSTPLNNQQKKLADQIVDYAMQFKGYPYVYGTEGPDTFDCSGFTYYVYKHFGYTLNRTSKDQLKNGTPVEKSDLQPADLVLFSRNGSVVTHVGLYIGEGKFIHASTSTTGVIISNIHSTYYTEHFFAARRII